MLYVTTRDPNDAYTANRALSENRCPEGGFFVPMRLPHFDESAIAALAEKSFSQNVADILNLLFGTQLDGWGVEFGVGRYPVKLVSLNSRTVVAESWHNPMYRFERLANGIEKAVRQSDQINQAPTDWLMIASRIATLFGIVGQLFQNGTLTKGQKLDISLAAGNFSAPMAAWYARAMGLPIGMIVSSRFTRKDKITRERISWHRTEIGALWNVMSIKQSPPKTMKGRGERSSVRFHGLNV